MDNDEQQQQDHQHLPIVFSEDADQENLEIDRDYRYSREMYKMLMKTGEIAITKLADDLAIYDDPRVYRILADMMKATGETTDKLMQLQKVRKEIKAIGLEGNQAPNLTQNNMYFGTTKDIKKLIEDGELGSDEEKHE
jgi:hypothetical protein